MANLALLIFGFVFLTQAVAWVGQSVLQELAFAVYSRIFLSRSKAKQQILRKQVLEDKAELGRTSSQDEFAKWARLKRKLDKGLADLEKLNSTIGSARSSFSLRFSSVLWILTTGAQLVLVWYYRSRPVFWLPKDWVPGPIAWLLSFPSAPKGAVSSGAWCAVCKRVLITAEEIVRDLTAPSPVPAAPVASFAPTPKQSATVEPLEHEKLD